MSDKKNIDRLFQEKFKDFEAAPPEFVWENIREILEEKKKKRAVPLWFRLSGVAAVIIMALLIGNFYLNGWEDTEAAEPAITTTPNAVKTPPLQTLPIDNPEGKDVINRRDNPAHILSNPVVNGDGKGKQGRKADGVFNDRGEDPAKRSRIGLEVKDDALVNNSPNKTGTSGSINKPVQNDNTVAANNAASKKGSANANRGNINSAGIATNAEAAVADHEKSTESTNTINDSKLSTRDRGGVANNSIAEKAGIDAGNDPENKDAVVIDKTTAIPKEELAEAAVDTAVIVPENELEKLLREQQKDIEADKELLADNTVKNKWNVKPQLAPVFYNSLSKGSPIDGQFATNAKSYENDLSMGVGINYALTNKITIRSGVNTVNLNYATEGVEFYASLNNQTSNVAARSSSANIVVQNQGTTNVPQVFFADKLPVETFNGSMVQKTGYVEVPVEMAYALLNKKFGIDIIGGVSTLFLNQNNVSVVSLQGYSTSVGKAQNLNNIHFSANLGVGFKYRFFKAFEANFEPMFKYQVNTFSRDAGNFKPYFIGLYSGVSFSF